jgi:hypothetical protein
MDKPINYDNLIGDLIKKIDNEKSLFRLRDIVRSSLSFILITFLILFTGLSTYYLSSFSSSDKLVIIFAALALVLSYGQFVMSSFNEKYIDFNYYTAIEKFKVIKEEEPLLKALIKMKSERMEFTLSEIYEIDPEMFSKEKLLERLYDG